MQSSHDEAGNAGEHAQIRRQKELVVAGFDPERNPDFAQREVAVKRIVSDGKTCLSQDFLSVAVAGYLELDYSKHRAIDKSGELRKC